MILKKYTRMVVLMLMLAIVLGLAACGGKASDESQTSNGENTNIQEQQPTVPENTTEQIDPGMTDTSDEDYMWICIDPSADRQYVFVFYDNTAKLYAYDPKWGNTYYLKHPYECS